MAFMAVSRIASKRLLGSHRPLLLSNIGAVKPASSTIVQESLPRLDESHDDKNARLNRPMSPHITIYDFGMSGYLSITHRITGCALSVYALGFGTAALCMSHDFNYYVSAIEAMHPNSFTILTAKFILAFPFMYHICNGVRHLVWDTGKHLNKQAVISTGSIMLAATAITTLLAMFL